MATVKQRHFETLNQHHSKSQWSNVPSVLPIFWRYYFCAELLVSMSGLCYIINLITLLLFWSGNNKIWVRGFVKLKKYLKIREKLEVAGCVKLKLGCFFSGDFCVCFFCIWLKKDKGVGGSTLFGQYDFFSDSWIFLTWQDPLVTLLISNELQTETMHIGFSRVHETGSWWEQ